MPQLPDDRDVVICECFARDGLQHETAIVPTDRKLELLALFTRVGFRRIEATSFAHPGRLPQFADAEEILERIPRAPGLAWKATCVNPKAVERARAARADGRGPEEISLVLSATDAHNRRNFNRSKAEQWNNVAEMAAMAVPAFDVVGTISCALGCPFEGAVDPAVVEADAARFLDLGVRRIALGDTTGLGTPPAVADLAGRVARRLPEAELIAHFHDTRGTAIANCVAAWQAGVRFFDSAFGGVGGHPASIRYGDGNTGNVATEDLVTLFEAMGVRTGLDLPLMMQAADLCEATLGRQLLAQVTRTRAHRPAD
jgi:hydroxymethylglutaryl-CoA lyase